MKEDQHVEWNVYPDKLMIWNPGELPPLWTVEKLLEKHASIPYNPDVASVFFRAGMIEAWGQGIERILEACHVANTPTPELRHEHGGLWLEFPYRPEHRVFSGHERHTEAVLQVTGEVTGEDTGEVTGEVGRLVLGLKSPMSRVQLQKALGLRHEDHFRERYLGPALREGYVEMTIPDKPTSGKQRYRLTTKGEMIRAKLLEGQLP